MEEFPGDEFWSGGRPVVFALKVVPVALASEFFVLSGVEKGADELVVDVGVGVDRGSWEWDDLGCWLSHLESHDGGFGVGFDVVPFW